MQQSYENIYDTRQVARVARAAVRGYRPRGRGAAAAGAAGGVLVLLLLEPARRRRARGCPGPIRVRVGH